MKRKLKTSHVLFGCAGFVLLAIPVVGFLAWQGLTLVTGKPYFDTPRDRAKLREIRDPYRDVPSALEAHRATHGSYPKDAASLDHTVAGGLEASGILRKGQLGYSGEPTAYCIYLKLNWDGGLVYESNRREWVYDPGNGDPSWKID